MNRRSVLGCMFGPLAFYFRKPKHLDVLAGYCGYIKRIASHKLEPGKWHKVYTSFYIRTETDAIYLDDIKVALEKPASVIEIRDFGEEGK